MAAQNLARAVYKHDEAYALPEFASASAQASMTKRIRMSEAIQQARCVQPRVNHAWIAGFVAINGHWVRLTRNLIWISDSIGELWAQFQTVGVLFGNFDFLTAVRQPSLVGTRTSKGDRLN